MTVIDKDSFGHPGETLISGIETERRHVLAEYEFPRNRVRVEVVGPNDSRIDAAHAIEVAAMAELGDPEEEVRAEFAPYRDSSIYFLAFKIDSNGSADELRGMGRIIPSSEATGNKSLIDLASIEGWDIDDIPAGIDPITGETTHAPADVFEAFKRESGCESLDTVWDLATLGFDVELDKVARVNLAKSIISAFTQEAICEWKRGRLTHCTSFNQVNAHDLFLRMGYPYHEMFALEPMMYDSFGTNEGMEAQPAWLSMEEVAATIEAAKQDEAAKYSHMARLALRECAPESIIDRAF